MTRNELMSARLCDLSPARFELGLRARAIARKPITTSERRIVDLLTEHGSIECWEHGAYNVELCIGRESIRTTRSVLDRLATRGMIAGVVALDDSRIFADLTGELTLA